MEASGARGKGAHVPFRGLGACSAVFGGCQGPDGVASAPARAQERNSRLTSADEIWVITGARKATSAKRDVCPLHPSPRRNARSAYLGIARPAEASKRR